MAGKKYRLNPTTLKVLDCFAKDYTIKQIIDEVGISNTLVYEYIGVLIREGLICKKNSPYEVTNYGKNYFESSERD